MKECLQILLPLFKFEPPISIPHLHLRISGTLLWRFTISFDLNNNNTVCLTRQKVKTKKMFDVWRDCGDALEAQSPSCCGSLVPHDWTIMVRLLQFCLNNLHFPHAWTSCSTSSKGVCSVLLCRIKSNRLPGGSRLPSFIAKHRLFEPKHQYFLHNSLKTLIIIKEKKNSMSLFTS